MKTAEAYRKHLIFLGRRNSGKSSLFNAFVGSEIAIVADHPGTTTDPVYKSMELSPIGPIMLIDTAGIDDEGYLGKLRASKTNSVLYKADAACLVIDSGWTEFEDEIVKELKKRGIPFVVVITKSDLGKNQELIDLVKSQKFVYCVVSKYDEKSIEALRVTISSVMKEEYEPPLIEDLVDGGDIIVLVVPIDLGAPKGRLIVPQIEVIRECLDAEAIPIVTKERELRWTLESLKRKPKMVVTDSQAVMRVVADVPLDVPMTTFSILEARHKGDLLELVRGLSAIPALKDGDDVLIGEACTHRTLADDIARVKIPRWLMNFIGKNVRFSVHSGREYPEEIEKYKLIIHCGGCVVTRNMMLRRIEEAKKFGVPIVNYGVIISYLHGVLGRALEPFPQVKALYEEMESAKRI